MLLGGFKRCTILDEPTAALLSYINGSTRNEDDDDDEDDTTYKLVYDIGGGTLDVSIAKLTRDDYGGYTVDIVGLSIGAYFLKEFEATNSPIQSRSLEDQGRIIARIVSNAEDYKIMLNDRLLNCGNNPRKLAKEHVNVAFELIDRMFVNSVVLKKQIFDELFYRFTSPNETKFGLLAPIKTALRRSNLQKDDIS